MTSTSTLVLQPVVSAGRYFVWLLNGVAFQSTNKVLIITTTVASGVRREWSKKVLLFTHLYAIAARYCLASKATSFISLSLHIFLLSVCLPACLQPMNHHGVLLQFYHEGMLTGLMPTPCSHGLVIQFYTPFSDHWPALRCISLTLFFY